jgi:hypothetical protein
MKTKESFMACSPAHKLGWARPYKTNWHPTIKAALAAFTEQWPTVRKITVINQSKSTRMVFTKVKVSALINGRVS